MAKKQEAVTHSLPKTLYAYEENDGKDTYLVAGYSIDDLVDSQKRIVGTYQFVEAGRLQTVPSYEKL